MNFWFDLNFDLTDLWPILFYIVHWRQWYLNYRCNGTHFSVRERMTAIIPRPQHSAFICAGSFSHVQLTIRPLDRHTSADTMTAISDELPPKTPAEIASQRVRSGTRPYRSRERWTDSRTRLRVDNRMPLSMTTLEGHLKIIWSSLQIHGLQFRPPKINAI